MKLFVLCMIILGFLKGSLYAQEQKLIAAPNVIPPATEAMQYPEYWISRIKGDPDNVILKPDHIRDLNRKAHTRPIEGKDINGNPYTIKSYVDKSDIIGLRFRTEDPLSITSIPGDSLRARFKRSREYFTGRTYWDRRHLPYTGHMKEEIIEKTDEQAVPHTVYQRYGILTAHSLNRVLPTYEAAYGRQFGWLDMLQSTSLETGTPVSILHMTKDRDWYYIKSYHSFGWVPASQVAFGTAREIRGFTETEDFIVALSHKVPVYADSEFNTFISDIYQGARLKMVKKTGKGYTVILPFRRGDGSLEALPGWVKPDADVHVGYQPFTGRNVITTVFRLLYRPYSWMGTGHERSCSGTVRSVLRTFGIFAARGTSFELHYPDNVYVFPEGTSNDIKYRYLDSCEPGITLCGFDGHIVFYLGKVDGVHYVIHQNGYSYHDDSGTELRVGRVVVNDTELEGGSKIDHWTEISVLKP